MDIHQLDKAIIASKERIKTTRTIHLHVKDIPTVNADRMNAILGMTTGKLRFTDSYINENVLIGYECTSGDLHLPDYTLSQAVYCAQQFSKELCPDNYFVHMQQPEVLSVEEWYYEDILELGYIAVDYYISYLLMMILQGISYTSNRSCTYYIHILLNTLVLATLGYLYVHFVGGLPTKWFPFGESRMGN